MAGVGSAGGPFTGLYQGNAGQADAAAAFQPLLPSTGVYQQGSSSAPALQSQVTAPQANYANPTGNLAKFENFFKELGVETGHVAGAAARLIGHTATDMALAPIHLGENIGHGIVDRLTIDDYMNQSNALTGRIKALHKQYQYNLINTKQYQIGLKLISQDAQNLSRLSSGMMSKAKVDQNNSWQSWFQTSADLITIMTGGFSRATSIGLTSRGLVPQATVDAANFLKSKAADIYLSQGEQMLGKVGANPEMLNALNSTAKNAIQKATAEVIANSGGSMTAGQIARAAISNVAIKYPLYFSWLSPTAQGLYQDLEKGHYGDAIKSIAYNAGLVLSGGPIEKALKYGGAALKGVTDRTFNQTAFWDHLSTFYGDGSKSGFSQAVSKLLSEGKLTAQDIKDLSSVEAVNVSAANKEVVPAVERYVNGMQKIYGSAINLNDITHEQAILDMLNYGKAFRIAQEGATKSGLGSIAIGRGDVRDVRAVGKYLADYPVNQRPKAWQQWKEQNNLTALANNDNFDKQAQHLMGAHQDAEELKAAFNSVKASTLIDGLSKTTTDKLAQMGYIPIKPGRLEAPYVEGAGKFKTAYTAPSRGTAYQDLFTHAVQPLPVLGHIGALFTHMGLSPLASTERAYDLFTQALHKRLDESSVVGKILERLNKPAEKEVAQRAVSSGLTPAELKLAEKAGLTPEMISKMSLEGESPAASAGAGTIANKLPKTADQATDHMIKQLSNYAHGLKVPKPDLRMLTYKDIAKALNVSDGEARVVQDAIARAHTDVPIAVRGLGDTLPAYLYRTGPTAAVQRRYLAVQGALRYSWNPVFRYMRLIPKTEILSESLGGGWINSVFAGRLGVLPEIQQGLREGGFLDKKAGQVLGGEAVDGVGTERNLTKSLVPAQEKIIAGLVDAQARRMGMSWQDYIKNEPQYVRDTIQGIAQYSRKSQLLNSPLMRTLNIAFFPMRFETKVAQIFGRGLARLDTASQVAIVTGVFRAHDWLNSPEGQAWYAHNTEVIGLFKYVTPFAELNQVFQSLIPGHDHHLGNFGEVGGLPFGWIPLLLDAEGLTHFNQPGADPKTGQLYTQHLPATTRGQMAIAIQDLLSSLFTYPGATVGLPSKTSAMLAAGKGLTGAQSKDFISIQPQPDAQQAQYQRLMASQSGQAPAWQQDYRAQPSGTMFTPPTSQSVDLVGEYQARQRAKAKSAKLKKGQYIPQLLPGQTTLGQL